MKAWRLDNAAAIMPAVTRGRNSSLFRISMDFDEPIDAGRLGQALDRLAARFPYFMVELRRDFFRYRLVPSPSRLVAEDDPPSPSQGFHPGHEGTRLFRIRAKGNRLAGEFSHIVADGRGGLRFMKTLAAEYLRLGGMTGCERHPDIYDLDALPDPGEFEDAYLRHYRPGLPPPRMEGKAFRLGGGLLPEGEYRVSVARLPLAKVQAEAKARGASLTEFMAAVHFEALQAIWLETPVEARRRSRIALEIPVDLRRHYESATNRNFALFAIVGADMAGGPLDFDDLLQTLRSQFRSENVESKLAGQLSRNVGAMLNPIVRALPLRLKDIGARVLFSAMGENLVSGVITNLGPIDLPEALASRILRLDLTQPPSSATGANLAMHSYSGELYLSVGSLLRSRRLEEALFARLAEFGFAPRVDCNLDPDPE